MPVGSGQVLSIPMGIHLSSDGPPKSRFRSVFKQGLSSAGLP